MGFVTNKYIQSFGLFVLIVGGYLAYKNLTYEVPLAPVSQVPSGAENQNITGEDKTASQTNTDSDSAASPSTIDYSGTHIMVDGSVMMKDGTIVSGATINEDGTITMSDGTIVTPAFDMRPEIESAPTTDTLEPTVKDVSVNLEGTNYAFDLKTIKVKLGDRITINLKSTEGFHDFVVDEFKAATERINEGENTSITFVADKKGTFQYYCSVSNHRNKGMIGYLVVE